jgi:hypothetical protein
MNDASGKSIVMGMMDRGFTVFHPDLSQSD